MTIRLTPAVPQRDRVGPPPDHSPIRELGSLGVPGSACLGRKPPKSIGAVWPNAASGGPQRRIKVEHLRGVECCRMSDRDSKRHTDRSRKHLEWLPLKTVPNRRSTKLWRKTPSPTTYFRNREFSSTATFPGDVGFIGLFGRLGHRWRCGCNCGGGGRGTGIEPSPRKLAC